MTYYWYSTSFSDIPFHPLSPQGNHCAESCHRKLILELLCVYPYVWVSLVAQTVKNLPAMRETQIWSLGWENPLEKGMVTHSSIPGWRIPWMEEPGRLQSTGWQRAGHDWATNTFTYFILVSTSFQSALHLQDSSMFIYPCVLVVHSSSVVEWYSTVWIKHSVD